MPGMTIRRFTPPAAVEFAEIPQTHGPTVRREHLSPVQCRLANITAPRGNYKTTRAALAAPDGARFCLTLGLPTGRKPAGHRSYCFGRPARSITRDHFS